MAHKSGPDADHLFSSLLESCKRRAVQPKFHSSVEKLGQPCGKEPAIEVRPECADGDGQIPESIAARPNRRDLVTGDPLRLACVRVVPILDIAILFEKARQLLFVASHHHYKATSLGGRSYVTVIY